MKKTVAFGLVLTLTLCLFAGCKPTLPTEEKKDSLTLMTVMAIESLDPYSGSYGEKTVPRMMFDTLFNYDANGQFVPCLAKEWKDDGMNLTITLREDVNFTDGEHFTADDVMFAYEQYANNPAFAARIDILGACEKIGEYEVVFRKNTPYAAVQAALTEQFSIVSSKAYSADPAGFANNPIGSGPYKYVSQTEDGSVVFTANEDYFLGSPSIKNVTIKPPVDSSTAVISLQAGEIDLLANVAMAQRELVMGDKDLVYVEKNAWIMSMLLLCGEKFEDVNLRKAVYHALDLESIVLIGNEGAGEPATNLATSLIMGRHEGSVPFGEYDMAKANEYLAASNYTPGTECVLAITPDFANVAQVVQANLAAIGIPIKIDQMDLNALYTKMFGGEIEMTVTYIGNGTTSIESIINGYNTFPFDTMLHITPELNAAINEMAVEADPGARGQHIVEALGLIKDNADFIPLYEFPSTAAYIATLEGVQDIFAASNLFYVNQMSFK